MDLTELYKKQISMTEWFENIKHANTEILREEDNEKRERMRRLNELIGLPFDKPTQFSAKDVDEGSEEFKNYLLEHGDELCALRLIPLDSELPKLRMRGHKVRDVIKWFKEQDIDYSRYKADFVPHPETPIFSSIFVVNSKGIFGEIIRGGHHQLTQGFHDEGKPIVFSFDLDEWKFSEEDLGIKEHVEEMIVKIKVEGDEKKRLLSSEMRAQFTGDYLRGYFETVKSKEQGLWFIDYNRTLADLYEESLPVIQHAGDQGVLSGQVASTGKVSGRVRIISPEEVEGTTLNQNEILVCDVTTPDYFNIMQQAVGIVTNGGGVLSHAGIIAREMGKPCIVGTNDATEVLREGDLIELDADKGVVRKLEGKGVIHKIGAIILKDKKILVGKKKNKFIIPGGRIEGDESHIECLKRELKEEFEVDLVSQEYFGSYEDEAALDPGMKIKMDVYLVIVEGEPKASSEIEESIYVNSKNKNEIELGSVLDKFVIPGLESKGLID